MKKLSLKLWAVLAVLLGLPAQVWAADDDLGYYFRVNGCTYAVVKNAETVKEVALTSCDVSGNPTEVTIPETVTHPTTGTVFTVAYVSAFRGYLPTDNAVTSAAYKGSNPSSIGLSSDPSQPTSNSPFYALRSSLTTIHLPKTIQSIVKYGFYTNSAGTAISTPSTSDQNTILNGMNSKGISFTIPDDNDYLKVDDKGVIYSKDGETLYLYPTGCTETSYTVLPGTKTIYHGAFNRGSKSSLEYLTTVVLPASVRTIGVNTFLQCKKLSSINIPTLQDLIDAGDADASGSITKGVTIHKSAFESTTALKTITLPNSITMIDEWAFAHGGLTSVDVPGSMSEIRDYVFYNCLGLTTATVNEGITSIGLDAFAGCTSMTSVTLPEGLLTIKTQAFGGCTTLPSITIPSTVTSIGNYAFVYDYKMTTINIPAGATLGKGVFAACPSLENITVDGGTRYEMDNDGGKLDKGVLYGNSNNVAGTKDELVFFIPKNNIGASNTILVKQWIVPNHVKKLCAGSIGESNIESLVLPSGLTTIDELAFFRNALRSLNTPGFGPNAAKPIYLRELTIPASVTSLSFSAFFQQGGRTSTLNSITTTPTSYFQRIYFMGTPEITTGLNLSLNEDGGRNFSVFPGGTYIREGNNLAFYVKNSNLSNSVFNTAKNRVTTFSADIPIDRLTEEGKIASMSRDFDVDFSNATGMKAYIATGFDEANKGMTMQEVKYVPSRTGANKDEYHGIIIRQTAAEAGTYRIGENDYSSGSQTTTFVDGSNNAVATTENRLVSVVVNSHVQAKTGDVNNWGLSNGKWQRIVNTGKLTPYDRAYLLPTAEDNAKMLAAIGAATGNNAKVNMIFLDGDSEVTGITTITEETSGATGDDWYTINGQRLTERPTAKGIYIHNGRKEVIR